MEFSLTLAPSLKGAKHIKVNPTPPTPPRKQENPRCDIGKPLRRPSHSQSVLLKHSAHIVSNANMPLPNLPSYSSSLSTEKVLTTFTCSAASMQHIKE